MTSYWQCVDELEKAIGGNLLHGSEQSKNALRELVDAVIISAPESDESGIRIEVRGYLSQLTAGHLFPQRSYQGGKVVAEEGLEPPPRGPPPYSTVLKLKSFSELYVTPDVTKRVIRPPALTFERNTF
jgi:hypothetical protein